MRARYVALVALALVACKEAAKKVGLGDSTVVDTYQSLGEGQRMSWRVPPGTYRVVATTDARGFKVRWSAVAGCEQPKREVKSYDTVCTVIAEGAQLSIENPAGLTGTGPAENIAVKVTRE